ncbi:MAG: hypothetical protein VW642_12290, partial [Halieaceae bacterium]
MTKKIDTTNRFGNAAQTSLPANAPLANRPGHKLRTSNKIVDRTALESTAPKTMITDDARENEAEVMSIEG